MEYNIVLTAILIIGLLIVFAFFVIFTRFFGLWIQSILTGAGVGLWDLIGMKFRKVDAALILKCKIMAVQAGLSDEEVSCKELESLYLTEGHVYKVVRAMVAARKAKIINLNYEQARAIDLAGRDVLESVCTSVYPKVIDCPDPSESRTSLDGVAKDGIQLKVKARVTVRANLQQLIGGAGEKTIIARVGEGIVSAIGSAEKHGDVLENPDRISKTVLERRLDSQTAFEIVSIDIADIDVGENIGAKLQADQAQADTQYARARAEKRRAQAVAQEQANIARIEENRAKLVQAEAEVPLAIADAIREGKLSLLDYFKLKNIQADTAMRDSLAKDMILPAK